MFASFTSSNLARAKTCPLTSDIIGCDCSHETCPGFVPNFSLISISIFRYSHQTNGVVVIKINTGFRNRVLFQ